MPTAEQVQDLLLESPGFTEFRLGLTAISASLLGGDTPLLCAITVERETGPVTVASSTETARSLDERQYAPIPTDNGSRSALNCCSTQLFTFGPEMVADIDEHAASLSRILRLAIRVHPSDPYPEHLRSALRSRAIVDSAVALIMVQNRCSHETAVKLPHLASRSSDRRLHDIAEDILHHASDIPVIAGGGEK